MKEHVGKNILFKHLAPGEEHQVREGVVQHLSSDGKYVAIGLRWHEKDKISFLQLAPDQPEPAPVPASPGSLENRLEELSEENAKLLMTIAELKTQMAETTEGRDAALQKLADQSSKS